MLGRQLVSCQVKYILEGKKQVVKWVDNGGTMYDNKLDVSFNYFSC